MSWIQMRLATRLRTHTLFTFGMRCGVGDVPISSQRPPRAACIRAYRNVSLLDEN